MKKTVSSIQFPFKIASDKTQDYSFTAMNFQLLMHLLDQNCSTNKDKK